MNYNRQINIKNQSVHLVSDATGTTLQHLAEAAFAQFDQPKIEQKLWPSIKTDHDLQRVLDGLRIEPGPVFYTLVEPDHIKQLEATCQELGLASVSILGPFLDVLSQVLGHPPKRTPGLQHKLDEAYFRRIEAIDFAMGFDDGQSWEGIDEADVILVGVSRTSKTPTCVYLARHGIMAANIPIVPHQSIPASILSLKKPLFVGLTESVDRLIHLRSSRLKVDVKQDVLQNSAYIDPEKVTEEVENAARFIRQQGWPLLDVTRRSVEETASEIIVLLQDHRHKK